jgi:hypothetical protein
MNGKLLSTGAFDPSGIILKPPNPSNPHFSEIWYLHTDNGKTTAVKPVFKTPRLPVKFSAKRFSEQSAYGYCLNMGNKDIDPEIGEFYDFVKQMDKALINAFTTGRRTWSVNPTTCLKYRTAMKRKTSQDDFYFQVKLIHAEKGASTVTVIYSNNGKKITPEDITYGKYADQFISPAYLYYDADGIHPIWQAHQIVISTVEKVFLEHCILDHLGSGSSVPHAPAPPCDQYYPKPAFAPAPPPLPSLLPPSTSTLNVKRLFINPMELNSVISGLRKIPAKDDDSDSDSY